MTRQLGDLEVLADLRLDLFEDKAVSSLTSPQSPVGSPAVSPELALVLTRCGNARQWLLTEHRFGGVDGLELGAGVPVDAASAVRLLAKIGGAGQSVWLEPQVLSVSPTQFMWYLPPARRRMLWAVAGKTVSLTVPYPGLVLAAGPNSFRIYAYKGSARPQADTPLYHAPLPNIHGNGELCFGNIAQPPASLAHRAEFEAALLDSRGTHPNHPQTLRRNKSEEIDLFAFWRQLHRAKARRFPQQRLVSCDLTPGALA